MMAQPKHRFFVPEVVQTSAMDCGPATLKSLLAGFGITVSYGRLREACQTDVDGTSIDTLEEVALQLGLQAEQVMIPADHLLLDTAEALPAIVVVRLPNGLTHFVVVWNQIGPFVQVMDPSMGRRWLTRSRLLQELYIHEHPVPAEAWREWAETEGFVDPLGQRMVDVGLTPDTVQSLLDSALQDPSWHALAALDATTRMIDSLIRADGIERGAESSQLLTRFFKQAVTETATITQTIPPSYWSVLPLNNPDDEPLLQLRGTVLVRALGHTTPESDNEAPQPLSSEWIATLEEDTKQPEWEILRFLKEDGLLVPSVVFAALGLSALGILIEALLFRGLLDIGYSLGTVGERASAVMALLIFIIAMFLIELPIATIILRVGRRLETRLRIAFLKKIPHLGDRYFHSRLTSDMTQRVYDLRHVRVLPNLAVSLIRTAFQLILTAWGVIWLDPYSAPFAILATFIGVSASLFTQPMLMESDLRVRTHVGALSRFYLDALLGLIPIRTHSAEQAIRREHESLLVEWVNAGVHFYNLQIGIRAIEGLFGWFVSIFIVFSYIYRGGDPGGVLLLFYWTLNLPILGQTLADTAQLYPLQRNRILRLLEPLNAPEEQELVSSILPSQPAPSATQQPPLESQSDRGLAITMQDILVQAGGHVILSNLNLTLNAGEHIGIVGPSGAGKSSLVGLLLGWHRPTQGHIWVDGELLEGDTLQQLRQQTAWVDPAVQIWNRTLFENLRYGASDSQTSVSTAVEGADLFTLLERLPQGMQTVLGEGGGLVSGGEGQRVRLGRGLLRDHVKLVILDEPFRGLDRQKRKQLLQQARAYWQTATLLCITHDVGDTQLFDRVLVLENGEIIEDDNPTDLLQQKTSRYHTLIQAEQQLRDGLWTSTNWRRLWLAEGKLSEIKHD